MDRRGQQAHDTSRDDGAFARRVATEAARDHLGETTALLRAALDRRSGRRRRAALQLAYGEACVRESARLRAMARPTRRRDERTRAEYEAAVPRLTRRSRFTNQKADRARDARALLLTRCTRALERWVARHARRRRNIGNRSTKSLRARSRPATHRPASTCRCACGCARAVRKSTPPRARRAAYADVIALVTRQQQLLREYDYVVGSSDRVASEAPTTACSAGAGRHLAASQTRAATRLRSRTHPSSSS